MEQLNKIKVLLAEDDPPIRQLLISHLKSFPQVDIIAAVGSGNDLLKYVEKSDINAMFLDIDMPDPDGLSFARTIREYNSEVNIIFVTAYPQYAAESYRVEATDYLVKPVGQKEIARAIQKIEKHQAQKMRKLNHERLIVKNNHDLYLFDQSEIIFIEKELKRAIIHTNTGRYITTETLYALESKLGLGFFRCHKAFIINVYKIERITPIADRLYEITFNDTPCKVTMRRKKFEELCSIISATR